MPLNWQLILEDVMSALRKLLESLPARALPDASSIGAGEAPKEGTGL